MRRDVQKNKNKQKRELKSKKADMQRDIYSSEGAYVNITTINLNRSRTEIDVKLPFNFILRDATELSNHSITYLCRASDMLILSITGIEVDYDLINVIKRQMPTVVIVHDKKLKGLARAVSKTFGSPKTCDFSMLSMILRNIQYQSTTVASERPFMIPADVRYCDGLLVAEGFMKNSLRSDSVVINGEYRGVIEEAIVDGEVIPGSLLNIEYGENVFKPLYEDHDNSSIVDTQRNEEDTSVEDVDLESQSDGDYDVEYSGFYDDQPISSELDLISKYSKYKGIRNLSSCTFADQPEEMPEYYKDLVFFRNPKHTLSQVKNRKCIIPKNKSVTLKIRLQLPPNASLDLNLIVLFNLFEYEDRYTILNYEFSSHEPLPAEIVIDNGFEIFKARCIVTRNLNNNAFRQEHDLVSGIVSFIGPLVLFSPNAFIVPENLNSFSVVRLFNGYSQNRIFFDCVELEGKPAKVCKRYVVVKGMFYNKEQVEYFRNVQLEASKGIRGFVKKPLGTKGAFKAYFAQPVKYGEDITMSLYKQVFL